MARGPCRPASAGDTWEARAAELSWQAGRHIRAGGGGATIRQAGGTRAGDCERGVLYLIVNCFIIFLACYG